jgi:uncharacterized YceG family protein
VSDDWLTEDPFADEEDPAARERAERREERERKRQEKAAKEAKQEPAPAPEPPAAAEPPKPKRSPEQEFWDEDPTPPPEPAEPAAKEPAPPAADREHRPPAVEAPAAEEPGSGARRSARTEEPEPPGADPVPPPPQSPAPEPPATDPALKPVPPPQEHAAPEPPSADPVLEPVPVAADPTRPASGEHLVPDPGAPRGRGQTSEEWAVVPAARAEALDDELDDEGRPEMTGAARTGRRSGDGGGRGRGGILGALLRHPFRIAAVVILLVVLYLLAALFQPFHGDGHGHVAVRIPKGASVSEVGEILERRGVLEGPAIGPDASTMFQIRVTLAGKRSDLFAGHFTLQKDMSYGAAIDALSQEPKAAKPGVTTVTVPEGYTRGQAAQVIREDGVPGNYEKATVRSKYLSPAEYGGKGAKDLEGFLFPDTFELKPKAPVKDLVQLQLQDFKRKIKKVNMKYAKSKNLTVFDVVTIASMIEREAGVAKQRKLVASVIYNRLREGIPLGIDATIRFATGNYEKPLTESELATDSPYNTRLNAGLPPGPINSPGLAALQAAAHPAETDYIYYVNDPDSCNELTFAKTDAEFEAAVAKYEKAREANGGNAPSTCGE